MQASHSKTTRFEALDGWRGLAALGICFYHVPVLMPLQQLPRWENMELMVDLFLVLSGFVIAHSWGDRIRDGASLGTFVHRRFWRVWPMHVAMLAVLVMLELAKLAAGKFVVLPLEGAPFTDTKTVAALFSNLALTQALNLHGTTSWNLPAWSISVEFWTYLVFAGVMLLARGRAMLVFVALSALALVVLVLVSPRVLLVTHDWGLARAIYDFFIGSLAYHLYRRGTLRFEAGAVVELITLAGLLTYLCVVRLDAAMWLAPLAFAALVVVFAQSNGPVHAMLMSRPVQSLGLWSYSIYMLHDVLNYIASLIMMAGARVMSFPLEKTMLWGRLRVLSSGNMALDIAVAGLLIATSVWLASYTWRYIEKPFMGGWQAWRARGDEAPLRVRADHA